MGCYKDNPRKPFIVRVPNCIRKRIAMHEQDSTDPGIIETILAPALVATAEKNRGSMWSRFAGGLANLLRNKPCGGR